ncbi:hypothetical protein ABEV79_15100 [Bacillus licheniformis]
MKIYNVQEIEKYIALNASYLIAKSEISIEDSRVFINDFIPEMAREFVKKYPKFSSSGGHYDYLEKIDDFAISHLIENFG